MSRNFHQVKHGYTFRHRDGNTPSYWEAPNKTLSYGTACDGAQIVCEDENGHVLFVVWADGFQEALLNVFQQGVNRGKRQGRDELARELRKAIGAS